MSDQWARVIHEDERWLKDFLFIAQKHTRGAPGCFLHTNIIVFCFFAHVHEWTTHTEGNGKSHKQLGGLLKDPYYNLFWEKWNAFPEIYRNIECRNFI